MSPLSDNAAPALVEALAQRGLTAEPIVLTAHRPDRLSLVVRTTQGGRVFAKHYPDGRGAATFDNMQKLWQSSFGEGRRPPGLPRPLDFYPESGILITEYIEGRSLEEQEHPKPEVMDDCIRLLAALHLCEAQPDTRRSSRGIMRSLWRKVERIAELAPSLAPPVRAAVAALEEARRKDSDLVPSHGDFSPRNVLVAKNRLVIVDWDRFQLADPCRDLAYFATWNWRSALLRGLAPDRRGLERAVAIYVSARPGARIKHQIHFHVAAGLLRQAATIVDLWPEEVQAVPALAAAALRELS